MKAAELGGGGQVIALRTRTELRIQNSFKSEFKGLNTGLNTTSWKCTGMNLDFRKSKLCKPSWWIPVFAAISGKIIVSRSFIWDRRVMWTFKVWRQFWALLKRDAVFRWLEEMLPLDTVLIRLCLGPVLSSGQQILWGTPATGRTSRDRGGESWWAGC